MSIENMTISVKADGPFLQQLEVLAARMEAAAAAMKPAAGELIEGEPMAFATLQSEAPSMLGPIAAVVVAGAVMAGSSTKRVSRRALLSLGFLRK